VLDEVERRQVQPRRAVGLCRHFRAVATRARRAGCAGAHQWHSSATRSGARSRVPGEAPVAPGALDMVPRV
jgi:hypothetical protein